MRIRGKTASSLLLGLFVSLSIVALMTVAPVQAAKPSGGGGGGGSTYSCSVAVSVASSTFSVKTTVNSASGSLPGPSETNYVSSYQNGVLYNTQSKTYSVAKNTATVTVSVPVPANGAGAYSFQSTILDSRGKQMTSCTGTYSL